MARPSMERSFFSCCANEGGFVVGRLLMKGVVIRIGAATMTYGGGKG